MNFLENNKSLRTLLFTLLVIFVGPVTVRYFFGTDKCLDEPYGGPFCGMQTLQVLAAIIIVLFFIHLFFRKTKKESRVENDSQITNSSNLPTITEKPLEPANPYKTTAKLIGIFITGPIIAFFLIGFLIILLMLFGSIIVPLFR